MKGNLCAVAVALLILRPISAAAQGGPPMQTDDPDTPGPGYWEINLATLFETGRDGRRVGGAARRSQLRRRRAHPAEVRDAVGDSSSGRGQADRRRRRRRRN